MAYLLILLWTLAFIILLDRLQPGLGAIILAILTGVFTGIGFFNIFDQILTERMAVLFAISAGFGAAFVLLLLLR